MWTRDGVHAWAGSLGEAVKVVVALRRIHRLRVVGVVSDWQRESVPLNVHHC